MREVEEVDEGLNVPRRQDVLADPSPVHALEVLLGQLLLIVVATATTRQARRRRRRVLLLGCSRGGRVGGRTVAQP